MLTAFVLAMSLAAVEQGEHAKSWQEKASRNQASPKSMSALHKQLMEAGSEYQASSAPPPQQPPNNYDLTIAVSASIQAVGAAVADETTLMCFLDRDMQPIFWTEHNSAT